MTDKSIIAGGTSWEKSKKKKFKINLWGCSVATPRSFLCLLLLVVCVQESPKKADLKRCPWNASVTAREWSSDVSSELLLPAALPGSCRQTRISLWLFSWREANQCHVFLIVVAIMSLISLPTPPGVPVLLGRGAWRAWGAKVSRAGSEDSRDLG